MAPYRLVPLLCSVGFLNSPVHSVAYSPPGLAAPVLLPNCPLQAHGRDVGCGMLDAGCQPLIPAQLRGGEGLLSLSATAGRTQRSLLTQEPAWMEAGAIREISATRHMYSYTLFKNQETLSPFVRLCGKARRGTGRFSKERPVFPLPVPKRHPGRVRGTLGCRPQGWVEGSGPQRLR